QEPLRASQKAVFPGVACTLQEVPLRVMPEFTGYAEKGEAIPPFPLFLIPPPSSAPEKMFQRSSHV
ncbi:MAG TPA: hypothetical protein P5101_07435, partial [Methanoculleus sp.]|nr:hypothetical protein [Methanoculleus sp.]